MHNSPYATITQCLRDVWRTEGVIAFYRSFSTSLLMNIPFHMTYLTSYEIMRKSLHPDNG